MSKIVDLIGLALAKHAQTDERIFVLDGDLADSDGAYHFAEQWPQRFLMGGIAEQNLVSVAAGMASAGRRPFVFSFAAFLCFRAFDQVRIGVSQSNQAVTLVGSHAGGLSGRNGKTHAAPNDLALMLSLPNIEVWAPADSDDVEFMLAQLLQNNHPAYIRGSRCTIHSDDHLADRTQVGRLNWLKPKRKTCIVSYGIASWWAKAVISKLELQGIELGWLHCLQLNDHQALQQQLVGVNQLIVIEDHYEFGGLASFLHQLCPSIAVSAIGWPRDFVGISGDDEQVLAANGLSCEQIFDRVCSMVGDL